VQSEQVIALGRQQAERRGKIEAQSALLRERQRDERAHLAEKQKAVRQQLKADYLAQARRIRIERAHRAPQGLAAFLGRVTGIALITKKVQRYRDRKRFEAHLVEKQQLAGRQEAEWQVMVRRHELQGADVQRKLRALDRVEERERKGLEQARTKERRQRINARHEHLPAFTLDFKPPGRAPNIEKAKNRYISPLARELAEAAQERQEEKKVRLAEEFARVARDDSGESGDGGTASTGPPPPLEPGVEAQRARKIELAREFNEAAGSSDEGGGGDGGLSRKPDNDGPDQDGPDTPERPKPRRTRKRDLDRGR